jgi:hypothetical protein
MTMASPVNGLGDSLIPLQSHDHNALNVARRLCFTGHTSGVGGAFLRHPGRRHAPNEAKKPASPDGSSIAEDLFGLVCRSVRAGRDRSASPPFGQRCQAIVFLRHPEQAALVLDSIRGQRPSQFRAPAPVIRIGQEISHRYVLK